jgi:hypothetical protein
VAVKPISSFSGASTSEELLKLSTQRLAEIVLQHLKSYEGTHTVMQNGMINRAYFIGVIEGRNMGLGPLSTRPEFGSEQAHVSKALEEAWSWLVNEGMLIREPQQPHEWYRITRDGEACLRRLSS